MLDDWQAAVVTDLLSETVDGKWAATSGALICPRQNGKGAIIEALELAWLFLCDVELIFHSAHLYATALDGFRRIRSLIQNTPELDDQVKHYGAAHGQERIELHDGRRLSFVARSKSGGRGFPAPVVVLDEAFNLSNEAVAALVPTMSAQANPFLLLTSSAPIENECSDFLRGFMRASREGQERRCYIEFAGDPLTTEDEQLRAANPGYGIRLNDDVIAEERRLLSAQAFKAERLGIVNLEASVSWVIGEADWQSCEQPTHEPKGKRLRYALDVDENGRGEQWASVAVSDGEHVEIVANRPGTGWIVDACVEKRAELGELVVARDGPAFALVGELEAAGLRVAVAASPDVVTASMKFLEAVSSRTLVHIGQGPLNVAARGAQQRPVGDGQWRWSRTLSTVDIGPLVAATLARWAASQTADPAQNVW